ncbi:uncharacterized protein G2W53_030923 [Senna tora]|uniref:Uncharacterized protein n=1 Tax=Senna tora TaxID=362788 RepID=A0A834T7D1_9FABA|nr:uncharacterized protein G2W53_030923 [Senna tora]
MADRKSQSSTLNWVGMGWK